MEKIIVRMKIHLQNGLVINCKPADEPVTTEQFEQSKTKIRNLAWIEVEDVSGSQFILNEGALNTAVFEFTTEPVKESENAQA